MSEEFVCAFCWGSWKWKETLGSTTRLCVYGARFCVCKISICVWIMTCFPSVPGDNEEIVSG